MAAVSKKIKIAQGLGKWHIVAAKKIARRAGWIANSAFYYKHKSAPMSILWFHIASVPRMRSCKFLYPETLQVIDNLSWNDDCVS